MTFEIKNNQLNGIAIFEDGVVNNNKFSIKWCVKHLLFFLNL
jgi:hypothetical protein